MDRKPLGKSDIRVAPISVGCWSFGGNAGDYWGAQDQKDVDALVAAAIECGANFFDTAYMYNDGRSEESLGKALKGRRGGATICTKTPAKGSWEEFSGDLQKSLKRMGVGEADVLMIHWPSPDRETMKENLLYLKRACEAGYVHYAGVSNCGLESLALAESLGVQLVANEFCYSLISRAAEFEVAPYCASHDIGITAYMSLMQGVLTGKYASVKEIPPIRRRTVQFDHTGNPLVDKPHATPPADAEVEAVIRTLKDLAPELGLTPGQLALAWCLAKPGITTSIVGCRNVAQLYDNVKAGEAALDADTIRALDDASQPVLDKMGNTTDIFGRDRIW